MGETLHFSRLGNSGNSANNVIKLKKIKFDKEITKDIMSIT